jgi:anti-repressor protein
MEGAKVSNEILPQVFDNPEFGQLRVIQGENGEPWFVASDIAKALGYRMASDMTRRLDDDEKGTRSVRTPSGKQLMTVITEAGVYSAILGSQVEGAKRFKRWVTHEVLPALRRDGAYVASDGTEDDSTLMARALIAAQRTIDRNNARIAELEPKALFADAVAASDGTCLVGELAKMMRQNGLDIGQNRMFVLLRDDGYLGKSGSNRNVPTQMAMDLGLFRIKETAVTHSDGHVTINRTPKVTGKGQRYFVERYCIKRRLPDAG